MPSTPRVPVSLQHSLTQSVRSVFLSGPIAPRTRSFVIGLLAAACATVAPRLDAKADFGAKTDFTVGTTPRAVRTADLNADGIPDLVTVNGGTSNVSVLLGTGGGAFGPKTDFATAATPYGLAIGDLNADGMPDLVVTSLGADVVSVLLGTGTGSFGAKTDFATGTDPRTVEIADLNANGKPDLVTANTGTNNVSVLLGTGTGSFGAKTDFATGLFPFSVAVGDLNGDGRLDLAVGNENSASVSVLLGTGTGSFGAHTDFTTGTTPHSVAIGDLNADAKADLAVANQGSSTLSILLGTGTGSFGAKTDFTTGSSPYALALGDVDGDGDLDVAVANQGAATASMLLGAGDGSFGPKTDFTTGAGPQWVTLGDLDRDGRPDLMTANANVASVSVLLNTYPYPPTPVTFARFDAPSGNDPRAIVTGDVNRDGLLDVVVANYSENKISVLLGDSLSSFLSKTSFFTATGPQGLALGDLDGDGDLDLAVANVSASIRVLLGNGDGTFTWADDYPLLSFSASVAIGDVNHDGRPDLVATDGGSDRVSRYFGLGGGAFGSRTDFVTGANPGEVAIADMNLDGHPDLVVANHNDDSFSVLLGTGTGSFGAKTDFATSNDPFNLAVGDVNLDGRPDVVTNDPLLDNASVRLNTTAAGASPPTFGAKTDFASGTGPIDLAFGDMNGDGKPDLLQSNSASPSYYLSVLTNSTALGASTPSFDPRIDFTTGNIPLTFALGDLNHDGKLDVAVANRGSNTVSLLFNNYVALNITVVGGGFVTRSPDRSIVPRGTTVQLTATADPNHHFTGWGGDVSGIVNPLSVPMNAAKSITANFAIDTHTLFVPTTGDGAVQRTPVQAAYDHGTVVTLTAVPAPGGTFVGWGGDASGSVNPTTVTIDANKVVNATFSIQGGMDLSVHGCPGNGSTPRGGRDPDMPNACSDVLLIGVIGTWSPKETIGDLTGIDGSLILHTAGDLDTLGFWDASPGACGEPGFNLSLSSPLGCSSPDYVNRWVIGTVASFTATRTGRSTVRLDFAIVRPSATFVSADQKCFGFLLQIDPSFATESGGTCQGCTTPVCLEWVSATPARTSGGATPLSASTGHFLDFSNHMVFNAAATACDTISRLAVATPVEISEGIHILPVWPNPGGGRFNLRFTLSQRQNIRMSVYDIAGRVVRTLVPRQSYDAGVHSVVWDGRDSEGRPVPSGLYSVRVLGSWQGAMVSVAVVH
jgi:hypothetical protein